MDRLSRTAETDAPQLLPLNLLQVGLGGGDAPVIIIMM